MNNELNLTDILVSKELSKIRQSKGISRTTASEETGLTPGMISSIENSHNVGLHNIIKYADYLGYEIILRKKNPSKIIDTTASEVVNGVEITHF